MAFRAGIRWTIPPKAVAANISNHAKVVDREVFEFAEDLAQEVEAYAKANHPWTNRTGAAEKGLVGEAEHTATGVHRVTLAQTATDRHWLEIARAGKWGIIPHALRQAAPAWAAFCASRGFK